MPATLEQLLARLLTEGEPLDALQEEYAPYIRDGKDDYLVSGDKRFRGIDEVEGLRILKPVVLYRILQAHNLL